MPAKNVEQQKPTKPSSNQDDIIIRYKVTHYYGRPFPALAMQVIKSVPVEKLMTDQQGDLLQSTVEPASHVGEQ